MGSKTCEEGKSSKRKKRCRPGKVCLMLMGALFLALTCIGLGYWLGYTSYQHYHQQPKTMSAVNIDPATPYYALIHSKVVTKVHNDVHANLRAIEASVPSEAYIFSSSSFPSDPSLYPSIANGHVGSAVHSEAVFMNGLYNGYLNDSHRARIPSTCSANITGTEPASEFTRQYILNVGEGIYSEVSTSEHYNLTHRIYAHRKINRLLVVEVDLVRSQVGSPLRLKVDLNKWTDSDDVTFNDEPSGIEDVIYKAGQINTPETETSGHTNVHVYYDPMPDELVPPEGAVRTKWVFLTSIAATMEEALAAHQLGSDLVETDELYAQHISAWADLWKRGRIDVTGNLKLAKAIYGSFYYILSSLPIQEDEQWPFVGLSPSGLPFGDLPKDYQGHVFWDQETWMYPPILTFYPDLAKILIGTRRRTRDGAAHNAELNGYKGYQYPWESAFTGVEVCYDPQYHEEIHITGDIVFSIMQYLYVTNDTSIIEEGEFGPLLEKIAEFWVSRVVWNSDTKLWEILDVIPPDEHHKNINNSVFTNWGAKFSLLAPQAAYKMIGKAASGNWTDYAQNIYIPYNETGKFHPEFDGYVLGDTIKQADVILLGYPFMKNMTEEVRRNDLNIYEEVTSLTGPAMSWGMYAIGWLELKEKDRADRLFNRNYVYIKNEFQVWSETAVGVGAGNFITGMGGFLQCMIFGYGGIRFHTDRLDFDPVLPENTTDIRFVGISYLGSSVDIYATSEIVTITLTEHESWAPALKVHVYATQEEHDLKLGIPVEFPPNKATIIVQTASPL